MNSSGLSLLMRLSKMHLKVSWFSVAVILLLCFNLEGPYFLGAAALVINGNETDRQALLQFKAKITGGQLGIMRTWNDSVHFCQWHGVKCERRHQRVTKLDLQALNLMGSISPFIGNLSFLRLLNLRNNSFIHEVPQEIGRLHRLQELTLDANLIVGEIPSNLSGCSKLTHLYIGDNQLVGEIPTALGHLSNLKELNFGNNTLRGSIPPFLGNLSSLEEIYLPLNRLSGVIPEALGQLKNLTIFAVGVNQMSGKVPSSLFNLSNIRKLDIGENNFQGSLPSKLGDNMPYLEIFSVSKNKLSGPFPLSITNTSNLIKLQMGGNKFTGKMPSFHKLEKLQRLHIYNNLLGSQGANDLNFLCSLTNTTNLQSVDMTDNRFGGMLPKCISNLSTSIGLFSVQDNNIVGRLPAEFGNLINLEVLAAGGNQFTGSIPFISKLQKLKLFDVNHNSISGVIPTSSGNLKMLIELHLNDNNFQGKIPPSLGKCENLVLLDLSNNNLSGSIPSEIVGLSSLSIILSLSSNRLTGVLPFEVGKLRNLGIFDVSKNKLSGVIPNELGSCIILEELLMNGNFFHGSIPSSLSSLRGLTKLDISRNNLTGIIPEFFVTFGALHYLNLSYNNFEGLVPVDGVFKNVSAAFLEGNSKLCGGTPEFHLPTCDNLKQHRGRSTISLKSIIAIVFALLGVILIFSLIFIFRFRKKRKHLASPNDENSLLNLSYQSILKATNGFSSANLVGIGSFGFVYKGILEENGTIIAVKILQLLIPGASRSFLAECEALRNVRHRNLVKVLTACSSVDYHGNDFKALVYEFMANGSLEDWLYPSVGMIEDEETAKSLNFFQRLNVAIDVACALEYLHHHCETPIVHCDLKPSNILLDDEMVGHVGDFGLAKFIASNIQNNISGPSSSLGLRGTIGYAPPEYGLGSNVTTSGDVYSYGILLLEMFTRRRPTDEIFKENLNLHNFVKKTLPNRVVEITDPTLLQECFKGETMINHTFSESRQKDNKLLWSLVSIFEIGIACSSELPTERMHMANVVAKLCSIRDKLLPT